MSGSQINYRENCFQHPSLTKINGNPTCTSLAKIEKECKVLRGYLVVDKGKLDKLWV
jgi:hypothetical protein